MSAELTNKKVNGISHPELKKYFLNQVKDILNE